MRAGVILSLVLSAAVAAPDPSSLSGYREVPVVIEPTQELKAISLRSGDLVTPVELRNGKALVPADFPLPWTVSLKRFESVTYTEADLTATRPLSIRELGRIKGVLQRQQSNEVESFTLFLRRSGGEAIEIPFDVSRDGRFDIALASGVYEGALLSEASGSRIRSGIVVHAGQTSDLGTFVCEPTVRVAMRVLDAKRKSPIAGASVAWDPPLAINANVSKVLFARRWSRLTDSRGVATFTSIGPLPMPLRWTVKAPGYAATTSRPLEVHTAQDVTVPDVLLRPDAAIVVRMVLPPSPDRHDFRRAKLVLLEPDEQNRLRYHQTSIAVPFVDGEQRLVAGTYGAKRLAVVGENGQALCSRDVVLGDDVTYVDLAPLPIRIHGSVTRKQEGVANATIHVIDAHEHDATRQLQQVTTDAQGQYFARTYQTGQIHVYATLEHRENVMSYADSRTIEATQASDYEVNFELRANGGRVRVVDAATNEPLHAAMQTQIAFKDGRTELGFLETDASGRATLEGFPEGRATLHVQVKGYRSKAVELPFTANGDETVIPLTKGGAIAGRIVDAGGAPVPGARITGGYSDENAAQAPFETQSDETGRFRFDSGPENMTTFYVAAAHYALGIVTLLPDRDNVVSLYRPSRSTAFVMPDNAPPQHGFMVFAAPSDGEMIPQGALVDLAQLNGLNGFQLVGVARDGSLALPQFLQPGDYKFFVFRPRQGYELIGSATLPAAKNVVIAFKTH